MGRLDRALRALHRKLGIALCAMFVLWFASGVVMTLQGYPAYTEAERLADALPLGAAPEARAPAALPVELGPGARLVRSDGQLVWLDRQKGARRAYRARDGQPVPALSAASVAARYRLPTAAVTVLPRDDQWTVAGHFNAARPLARVTLGDPEGTLLHVCLATGEVVQRSTRFERALAWLGAIPHWIYPAALRRHAQAWRKVVIGLSLAGCLLCLSGLYAGLRLWWRGRRRGRGMSPFTDRPLRAHHLLGLVFGAVAFTWVFSGMMSMNPLRWSDGGFPSGPEKAALRGGGFRAAKFTRPVRDALAACDQAQQTRELQLSQLAGRPYYLCLARWDETRITRADQLGAPALLHLPADALEAAVARLARGRDEAPSHAGMVHTFDAYHYPHRQRPQLRVPYFRAQLGPRTIYVDAHRARLLRVYDAEARLARWLYHGLHSWDFPWLYRHAASWYALVLGLLLGGLSLSITALALSVRRARRARQRAERRTRRPSPQRAGA